MADPKPKQERRIDRLKKVLCDELKFEYVNRPKQSGYTFSRRIGGDVITAYIKTEDEGGTWSLSEFYDQSIEDTGTPLPVHYLSEAEATYLLRNRIEERESYWEMMQTMPAAAISVIQNLCEKIAAMQAEIDGIQEWRRS